MLSIVTTPIRITLEQPEAREIVIEKKVLRLTPVVQQGLPGRDGTDGQDGAQTTSLPWENITGKPDVLEDSEIIDGGNF